jgi:hypothetical protein
MCFTDKVWITELILILKNNRSVRTSHTQVDRSIGHKAHYDVTDKNNDVSSKYDPVILTFILILFYERKFKQWWSTNIIKPNIKSLNTKKKPWHVTLEIQVLVWGMYKNVGVKSITGFKILLNFLSKFILNSVKSIVCKHVNIYYRCIATKHG